MRPGTRRIMRIVHCCLFAALLLPTGLFGAVPAALGAGTLTVNTTADDTTTNSVCSLRGAIQAINGTTPIGGCNAGPFGGSGTIIVPVGTYQLNASGLTITSNITISGAGVGVTTVKGAAGSSVFTVGSGATAGFTALTITGGNAGNGGGINNSGTLTLDAVRVTGNTASAGGGIYNNAGGNLTVTRSTIDTNAASTAGGGIASSSPGSNATLTITQSSIVRNTAGPGGGTAFQGGVFGGGVLNRGNSRATITNTTISENRTSDDGAGLYNNSDNILGGTNLVSLANATISHNASASQAGGIDNYGAINLHDTIVAQNTAAGGNPDCRTLFGFKLNSQGYNLIQTTASPEACTVSGDPTGNIIGQDPLLGSLRDNGGSTLTRALGSGSPAIDAGTPGNTLNVDQRGSERPVNGRADIGAYESGGVINDSWPTALRVDATTFPTVSQTIDRAGQSRWYKFKVSPNSKVIAQLTNLPANYDLTLYKDIPRAFNQVSSTRDLLHLGAEFAPDAFSPDAFSPDAFSPDAFSPDAFSPDAFSPDAFSPDAFSPDAFSPDAFSPDAFSPDAFSPDAFSPDAFSPDAFSSAQTRSLLAVSAFEGLASEGIKANTWLSDGDFYLRVRGRNGAFNRSVPFQLQVTLLSSSCASAALVPGSASATPVAGGYRTIILTDTGRMAGGTAVDRAAMLATLQSFAARGEIKGSVVDFAGDSGIGTLNARADAAVDCPYAKNLVAGAIKALVDGYRVANPDLQYVVFAGNDGVIPFFRHPDQALIGNERDFIPPVKEKSASQASLRTGYYLSQDRYGAATEVSLRTGTLPLPGLALGRLVETPGEIAGQITTYTTRNGAALVPGSSLVTGYDFLEDAAKAVQGEFQTGTGQTPQTLITPRGVSPLDPRSWTADQLRTALLGQRHDLIFLAGHFSAGGTLAADFTTRLLASELADSTADLSNTLIFSAGCHAGYNVVDDDAVSGVTQSPDWPQAAARKRAILIAGTGYQYGDTDFVEYSERLYRAFSQQLHAGTGGLAVGQVLVAAKQQYLAEVPTITGLHEKALLEATLFGLPMAQVDMPQGRATTATPPSIVTGTTPYAGGPGASLGLQYADQSITTTTTQQTVTLTTTTPGLSPVATYLTGPQGVVTNPAQPVLPLDARNVTVPNTALRGVGFRGGAYTDLPGVLPLTGAPTTEVRGVKVNFYSDVFFPVQPYRANYLGALAGAGGPTQLMLTPAQYRSDSPGASTGTLRRFDNMNLRLFYSSNTDQAAQDAAPVVVGVTDFVADGKLNVTVTTRSGSAAGIQEVWSTYTATSGNFYGKWQSFNLERDSLNPDLWRGTLNLNGASPDTVRYLVQAASGVGLVTMLTNQGAYYTPSSATTTQTPATRQATSLTVQTSAANGSIPFGGDVTVSASLLDGSGAPLANQTVTLALGDQSRRATTNSSGLASASIRLLGLPGKYTAQASFDGATTLVPSSASGVLSVTRRDTRISLGVPFRVGGTATVNATLTDDLGRPLGFKTIFLTASGGQTGTAAVTTDFAGRAAFTYQNAPTSFSVTAAFATGQGDQPSDDRYNPSTAPLTISAAVPIAANVDPVAVGATVNTSMPLVAPATATTMWDWGDGSTSQGIVTVANGSRTVSGTHNYVTPGVYAVTLTVTDKGIGTATATYQYVVVYDPSGGFVTGGGWINSPAGGYVPNPALTGKATFGFNAKYRAGATVPTGQTEFQFQVGNLKFKSTAYEWLVVSGARAQFKGSGTINGQGTYRFMLTAIDGAQPGGGGADKFRIRIWSDTGGLVYDNQLNAPDTADPTTTLGGGSITIQK